MASETQISAYISEETKAKLDDFVKRHGVKKAHLIEQALLHHLQALREIPEEALIPTRLVLNRQSMARLAELMDQDVGCVGVVVDAKAEAMDFYAHHGFQSLEVVAGELGDRPRPKPMLLSIKAISQAAGSIDSSP